MPDLIEPDLIEKEQPVPAAQAATRACDPVTLEIVRGAIRAAQAEMEALIERAAISAFIREKKDFYTALFDADGVLAPGSGAKSRERLAVHFASGTAEVRCSTAYPWAPAIASPDRPSSVSSTPRRWSCRAGRATSIPPAQSSLRAETI